MKTVERIITIALALCLVLALLPAASLAVDDVDVTEPEEDTALVAMETADAPVITSQPTEQNAAAGSTVTFSVTATGAESYQWQFSKNNGTTWANNTAAGCRTDTFSFTAKANYNGWQYRCIVTNSAGSTASDAAQLTVPSAPVITSQPASVTAGLGGSAVFRVAATGGELTYQWEYKTPSMTVWKDATSSGNKTARLTVSATATRNGYSYRCRISNDNGTVYSDAATLTVTNELMITAQPESVSAKVGEKVTFSVEATGVGLSYRWQYSSDGAQSWKGCSMSGYKTAVLTVPVTEARDGWRFRCIISTDTDTVTSETAALSVVTAPVITAQPVSLTANVDDIVHFNVAVSGKELSYLWQFSNDGGSTWGRCKSTGYNTNAFSFTAALAYSGRMYRCRISNIAGTVYSDAVALTVTDVPRITLQPEDYTAKIGTTAHFSVNASGGHLAYRWQYSWNGGSTWANCKSTGYNTNAFSFTISSAYSGRLYRCRISNSYGTVYSDAALLTALSTPKITVQPADLTVNAGETATFTIKAGGGNLSYQWQYSEDGGSAWANCAAAGNDTDTLSFAAALDHSGRTYRCIVTNSEGEVTSNAVTLSVTDVPVITAQPESILGTDVESVTFSVAVNGEELVYQWQYKLSSGDWQDAAFTGSDTAQMTVPVSEELEGSSFRCVISNSYGTVTSEEAMLTIATMPVIVTQPRHRDNTIGGTVTFTVEATGGSLHYQWQVKSVGDPNWRNSASAGNKTPNLTVQGKASYNMCQFRCVVSNSVGTVTTSEVTMFIPEIM